MTGNMAVIAALSSCLVCIKSPCKLGNMYMYELNII